ncbi:DUF305 domain-containing protein [Streptomyces chromofuscus]|uniref:DUF305 domain-containing protein n=1 Tax=Streptomyces chromofuscus TaxID=42881 RepID=A0A7M2TA40_STRCW|nr:DUF305 domain-containing protein [Streptomyces chromofuscus]QOV44815.1 DUF305 domain-containing protein [Streptomyces chromofuscus]GGT00003.1 lipoprotein [Streptomyces chromofuscus]
MHPTRHLARRTTALATAATAALVLAACGGGNGDDSAGHGGHGNGSTSTPAPASSASASASAEQGRHNAADVSFAQGMIPHHRQAVEMAELAAGRAQSTAVKELAAQIKKAQDPEIRTLSEWLTSWGEEVPADGAMDHSLHGDVGGMMSAEDMNDLGKASGRAFDTAFMEMMIEHHEGAVAMAETEQADGAYAPAKRMAADIISSQTAEIERMNQFLGNS